MNGDLGAAIPVNRISSIEVFFSEATAREDQRIQLRFMVGARGVTLPCDVALPADRTKHRLARFSPPVPMADVADILSQDALFYSQIVWLNTDPNELVMQMGGFTYDKRVIEFIDPQPVAVLGNAIGFVWNDEDDPQWQAWKKTHASASPKHDLVPLPTDGVFAEAVLGRFNSAEKLDMSLGSGTGRTPRFRFRRQTSGPSRAAARGMSAAAAGNLEDGRRRRRAARSPPTSGAFDTALRRQHVP